MKKRFFILLKNFFSLKTFPFFEFVILFYKSIRRINLKPIFSIAFLRSCQYNTLRYYRNIFFRCNFFLYLFYMFKFGFILELFFFFYMSNSYFPICTFICNWWHFAWRLGGKNYTCLYSFLCYIGCKFCESTRGY